MALKCRTSNTRILDTIWRVCTFLLLISGVAPAIVLAQTSSLGDSVNGETATPVPGVGHDYIHLLAETVDPSSGSVNIHIQIPTPNSRGFTLPFAITYSSAGVGRLDEAALGTLQDRMCESGAYGAGMCGWKYELPKSSHSSSSYTVTNAQGKSAVCGILNNYVFTDSSGVTHNLSGLGATYTVRTSLNPSPCTVQTFSQGHDDQVQAHFTEGAHSWSVEDNQGKVYNFTDFGLPISIEDRNGNIATITGGITDTAGRPLTITATTGSQDTIVSSGSTYTVNWTTATANYSMPVTLVTTPPPSPFSCPHVASPLATGTMPVISSITLPNTKQYVFYYGNNNPDPSFDNPYGLISEIVYPNGSWVKYTWKQSDKVSEAGLFAGIDNSCDQGPDGDLCGEVPQSDLCGYTYYTPVLASRTVSYDGVNIAQTQAFTYSTVVDTVALDWTSKTTSVTTTDNVENKSYVTSYLYTPITLPEGILNDSDVANQVPVERTVTTNDWGSSTPLTTVTKNWDDQFLLENQSTQIGNETEQTTYSYGPWPPTPSQIQETDFGGASSRTTAVTFQSFAGPLFNTSIAVPCKKVVTSSGGGSSAETDYYYDGGTSLCASPSSGVITAGVPGPPLPPNTHDETTFGPTSSPLRGNLSQAVEVNSSGSSSTTTYKYDETGQTTSMTDPCGNSACGDMPSGSNHTTTYSYTDSPSGGNSSGNSNAYLTNITDPLGHSTTYSYNYVIGALSGSVDSNNNSTSYKYGTQPSQCGQSDLLNRLTEVDYPDGGVTQYCYNDSVPSVETARLLAGSTWETSVATMDSMGHVIKNQVTSDPLGTDTVATTYDGMGNVASVTNPYRGSSPPANTTIKYTYDALRRKTMETGQDGTVQSWCYDGMADEGQDPHLCTPHIGSAAGEWVDFFDEAGNHWQKTNDTFGRLREVIEDASNSKLETDYNYDALNNLLSVNQIGISGTDTPRARTFTYDSLSRLTQAFNPETGWVCYGTTPSNAAPNGNNCTPSYDANGNLTARTDARGIKTSYLYDSLNRLTSKSYSDGITPTSLFVYDTENIFFSSTERFTTANVTGRLSVICVDIPGACQSMTAYSYDAMGRIKETLNNTPLNSTNPTVYTVSSTYDLAGNRLTLGNSTGRTFNYTYDGAGHLQTASHSVTINNLPVTTPMISSATYFASGQANVLTTNTGTATVTGTWGIDNRLRTTSYVNLSTANSPNTNYGYSLTYTSNGNVHTSSETAYQPGVGVKSWSWTYNYDTLNRLINGISTGAITYGCAETYDSFGNRTNQAPYGGGSCTTANNLVVPNINNRLSGPSYTYDAAGDMLTDGTNTLTYDAEGRVASSAQAGKSTTTYLYDANGERVSKFASGVETDYVRDFDGSLLATYVSGSYFNQPQELWVGGKHFGTVKMASSNGPQTPTNFSLTNWLGSEAVRTSTSTGIPSEAFLSQPFGDSLTTLFGTDDDDIHFTGKERDAESGNDYFGARYYASSMARFMSPDWDSKPQAVPYANLSDPQSLNLYSFVLNNPLSKFDPNGHDWFNVDGKWQWQKGHTYHDADGNATKAKGYAGLLIATATGTNEQGATTYSLTLYDQNKVVATGTGFSGNNNFADTGAIKVGNYQILGRFDAPPTGPNPASADNNPPPVYGYQKIDPTVNSYANAVYQAYGPMRARLNPLDPSNTDGVYFHGQFGDAFHSEGWTHGCLSYGRDTTMIDYMASHFGNAWTGVSVNTPVVKP